MWSATLTTEHTPVDVKHKSRHVGTWSSAADRQAVVEHSHVRTELEDPVGDPQLEGEDKDAENDQKAPAQVGPHTLEKNLSCSCWWLKMIFYTEEEVFEPLASWHL